MKPNFFLFLSLILICYSCNSGRIGKKEPLKYSVMPSLGVIGSNENNFFSKSFKESGSVYLKDKIKLTVKKTESTRADLYEILAKKIGKAERVQKKDSVQIATYVYNINISDKVGFLRALNNPENQDMKKFLELTGNNGIITSVGIYFPPEYSQKVDEALEVYLISKNPGSYSIELLNGDRTRDVLYFNQGLILNYKYSAFCWTEDYRGKLKIADFRDPQKACSGETVKSPSKIEREDLFESLR